MDATKNGEPGKELSKVTIEVPVDEVNDFKAFLDGIVSKRDPVLESPYCCYLTIRDGFGERHKQISMDANNIDEARVKCVSLAYDYYTSHPNAAVSGYAEQGGCRYIP